MFTNNWYTMFTVAMSANKYIVNPSGNTVLNVAKVVDTNGNQYRPSSGGFHESLIMYSSNIHSLTKDASTNGIAFGDGAVAPTKSDYCLSGNYVTTLSIESTTGGFYEKDGVPTATFIYVLKNTGSEPVTISEMAWFEYGYTEGKTSNSYKKTFMLARTLLDEPVTIPAGEQGVVVYKIAVTIPTA